ncbi:gamma-glutamylcyclotransferase [archaeon]|nr:MAG: gamma-glutamylcyclotransferase [archaeon]
MDEFPIILFAYGTLMKGYTYHYAMKTCTFLGKGKTVQKYAMYVENYPFITSNHAISEILGEIYEVPDAETLERIDQIEGHPHEYERRVVEVLLEGQDTPILTHLYFNDRIEINGEGVQEVPSGNFHESSIASARRV